MSSALISSAVSRGLRDTAARIMIARVMRDELSEPPSVGSGAARQAVVNSPPRRACT